MADTPPYEFTPVESIPSIVNEVCTAFHAHKTRPIEYRLVQLRRFYWGIKDNEQQLLDALKTDLGRPVFEAVTAETTWCLNDIIFTCNNLEKWAKDEKAPDIPIVNSAVRPIIRKDPLGCVLVIGAFNFPVQLSFGPMIGAIAAGNTVVLKPSENAPATAAVLQSIVTSSLDPSCYKVIQGSIPETEALLAEKWDKIFYTGSAPIGRLIAQKAASTLTPYVLELGGRNPTIVTKNADARVAARRLLWGKTMNAGQVCLAPNYALVERAILPALVNELKRALNDFFPDGAAQSRDFGRIVNDKHFGRIKSLLDASSGTILLGGTMDARTRFIEPTVVQVDSLSDALLASETFGPILPLYAVDSLASAIDIVNTRLDSTPLAIYAFGNASETAAVLAQTRSGGASINDTIHHGALPTLSFGGVGSSGQGAYRGRASFDAFVHRRSIVRVPGFLEAVLAVRYPPFSDSLLAHFRRFAVERPSFDRAGRVTGWARLVQNVGGAGVVRKGVLAVVLGELFIPLFSFLLRVPYIDTYSVPTHIFNSTKPKQRFKSTQLD
ncbi:MAG: hypothetical protein M1819_006534 [Sarea resinae]|nr:MAG: hypothetical protein M1819_006534 [Sarea resinae]